MLDKKRVIELLKIERECVSRAVCDRDCGKCELAQDKDELLAAFDSAVEMLTAQDTSISPRVLSVNDFMEGLYIPTVLWLERRGGDVVVGVWQIDHYEMEDGTTLDDIGLEFAENPEAYNKEYRIWTSEPDETRKKAFQWDDEEVEKKA